MGGRGKCGAARSELAWLAGALLALQLGLALAIHSGLSQFRDPAFHEKFTRLMSLRAAPMPPRTVVFLGSSRTGFGLQPGRLGHKLHSELDAPTVFFNFGMPGTGPVIETLALRRLLDEGVRPDRVLIEVVPMFLAGQPTAPQEVQRFPAPRFDYHELEVLEKYSGDGQHWRRDWWSAWPASWHSHRFEILTRFAPSWVPFELRQDWSQGNDAWGWGTCANLARTPESHRRAVESERRAYAPYFHGFEVGGSSCAALTDALKLCRNRGIPTALYYMPESAEFRSWYSPAMMSSIDRFVGSLSTQFSAPIIDARSWIGDEQFTDGHHLLPAGAAEFTDRLAKDSVLRGILRMPDRSSYTANR